MKPKKLTDQQIQSIIRTAVNDAVNFVESEIAPDRIKAQRYWLGKTDLKHEEGRSKVVATKVRDVIRTLKPALMRVFFQSDTPVEFVPNAADKVASAEQATSFSKWKFAQADGYQKLQDVIHDALLKKTGVLKVYYDETEDVDFEEYTNLTDEQFAMIAGDDDVEIVEHSQRVEIDGPAQYALHDVKASFTRKSGKICLEPIPPEDFFIDDQATSCDDYYVIGHTSRKRVGDVVAMGFDFDEVVALAGDDRQSDDEEDFERRSYHNSDGESSADPSMLPILLTEAYMRMDVEGTGIPRLYRFICGGSEYTLLDHELADEVPFAVFEAEPEPHAFFGNSIADLVVNEQDTATSLLRGLIDNVAMVNTPRTLYRAGAVPIDDLMNNEVGGLVSCKDPMTDIREVVVPPTAGAVLPAMQYFDDIVDSKTGISRAGMGMDADALQSTTAAGVNAAVQAASAAAELIARNLAEGGMCRTFKLIARLAAKHVEPGAMMRLNGQFIPVDPRAWSTDMDIAANVGLGTGAAQQRLAALQEHHAWQIQVYTSYGPDNGLVTLTNIRDTRAEMLRLSGIHNVEKHMMPMTQEIEQQRMMQAQEAAQQQPEQGTDPQTQAFMQIEGAKISARAQADMMESQRKAQEGQMKLALDAQKLASEDDRQRDAMEQKAILEAVGKGVDPAMIRALQARPRN